LTSKTVFISIIKDECFSSESDGYVYEVCLFKHANQLQRPDVNGGAGGILPMDALMHVQTHIRSPFHDRTHFALQSEFLLEGNGDGLNIRVLAQVELPMVLAVLFYSKAATVARLSSVDH
jgi:hypothetical protein